jgi:hypothetical protein
MGYILKIITKFYVTCNDDTTSFCYKNLITILVVMMMRRRRWTMMIWNILRMHFDNMILEFSVD